MAHEGQGITAVQITSIQLHAGKLGIKISSNICEFLGYLVREALKTDVPFALHELRQMSKQGQQELLK